MLLEQPAPEESKDESPLSQRMDLRGSASTLADPAIEFISRIFKEQGFNKNIQFDIEYDSIDFVAEATIGLNTISENLPMPSGEYFDVLGEVDFVIQGLYDPASSIFDLDAGYIHAGDEELEDAGLIETVLQIPASKERTQQFLQGAARHLRATLVHEMQHSIQRLIYGQPLDHITNADLDSHISDPSEIDARVEEVIAYMDDAIPETQFDNFMVKLEGYIDMYLERNAPDASMEEHDVYRTRMLDSHLQHYAEKLGLVIPS
tara:strand:- start:272 stop:1057 length:786 start_codon:yes stop_codon:yes gene_type:complete